MGPNSQVFILTNWLRISKMTKDTGNQLSASSKRAQRSTQASHESLLLPNWNATSPKFNLLWALIRVWALIPTNYFRLGSNSRMGLNSSRGPNSSKYGSSNWGFFFPDTETELLPFFLGLFLCTVSQNVCPTLLPLWSLPHTFSFFSVAKAAKKVCLCLWKRMSAKLSSPVAEQFDKSITKQ